MRLQFLIPLLILSINVFSQKEEFTTIIRNPCTTIKDQQNWPSCWSYATCSFLESEMLRLKKDTFDFSEDFFVYYTYFDKARNYVLRKGNTNFGPGGLPHDVMRIIKEKGIVPQQSFSIDSIQNFMELHDVLTSYLNVILKKYSPTENWMKHYQDILNSYFSSLPNQFEFHKKNYTPMTFASLLNINTDNYISFTSFTHHPYNQKITLELEDNYASGLFYNLPLTDFCQIIDSALINGYTVLWEGALGKKNFSNKNNGLALLPLIINNTDTLNSNTQEINVNTENRQISFERLQTPDDHAMQIIGIAKNKEGKKFYIIKNSFGPNAGPYNGYFYMSESFLKMKTISIMLNKSVLPEKIK